MTTFVKVILAFQVLVGVGLLFGGIAGGKRAAIRVARVYHYATLVEQGSGATNSVVAPKMAQAELARFGRMTAQDASQARSEQLLCGAAVLILSSVGLVALKRVEHGRSSLRNE